MPSQSTSTARATAGALVRLASLLPALALVSATGLLMASPPAHAAYPDKPIRIVVPFPPGGGTDTIARTLGAGVGQSLGQPVVVENRPGGGTVIGTDVAAKSPADGYTLLLATFAHAVNPSLHPKLPYSTEQSFTPVALVGRSPNVLVVPPGRPYKTVQDLVADARAHPGKLTFGSYGNGTSAHLSGELFKSLAKVDMTHVPYRGASPAITDLLGGQIDTMFTTVASVAQYIKAGKLRAIAVTSATRSPAFPNVPTIAESGVPGYVAESWYGVYAPAGTPAPVIARLNAAVRKAVQEPAFRNAVEQEGIVVSAGTPEELDRYVRAEEVRWRRIVQERHITAD
jgi:tripartite-type tricarboxylate transporter receptor subunit TctC